MDCGTSTSATVMPARASACNTLRSRSSPSHGRKGRKRCNRDGLGMVGAETRVKLGRLHDQHGGRRQVDDAFGGAAEQYAFQSRTSMAAHDDEVRTCPLRRLHNHVVRSSVWHFSLRLDALLFQEGDNAIDGALRLLAP